MAGHLRRLLVSVVSISILLAATRPAAALSAATGDDYFAAGSSVGLAQVVPGDALLAGGRVDSDAAIGGDAVIAGGQVAVRATVGEDLYAAGGRVEVDALIGGDARLAGGQVQMAPQTRVTGSVAAAGGSVTVAGSIGGHLTVAAGEVTLSGDIGGDVHVRARELRVLEGTRIGGNLVYRTSSPVTLPADLLIGGAILPGGRGGRHDAFPEPAEDAGVRFTWIWLGGLFAVGVLLAVVFARFSRRTSRLLTAQPWFGMLLGLMGLVVMPMLIVALFMTLVGIPLALILLPFYVALLLGAYVIGALFLGDRMLSALRPSGAAGNGWRVTALLLVFVALALIGDLPFLGNVANLAVLLLGLGGLMLAFREGAQRLAGT